MQTRRGGRGRTEHHGGLRTASSIFQKACGSKKTNEGPMIAIMARQPHIRKCSITLPGDMLFVNFFVFSGGSLDKAALRLLGEDLVAEVILRGWCLGSEQAGCDFFVFSSGSLVLGPSNGSFAACEDLEAEFTLCKPTGFGGCRRLC